MGELSSNLDLFNGLVVFYLNDKIFCANIDNVFAVVNPANYPKNFKNDYLINSHLTIEDFTISVIDLHSLFGLTKNKITPSSRFICIDINGKAFGFLADKVEEVITLNSSSRKYFELIESKNEKFLYGEVKYRDAVFCLPNFTKIINESFVHH